MLFFIPISEYMIKTKHEKKKHTYNSHPVITVFLLSLPSDPDKKLLYNVNLLFAIKQRLTRFWFINAGLEGK